MSLICASCRTENPPAAKFCTECAAPLARPCPSCGTANASSAKFCSECATPLTGEAAAATPATSPPAPGSLPTHEAERRLVSVLFADLVGFTEFSEDRDAEDVRESLTKYFDLAKTIVERLIGRAPDDKAVEAAVSDVVKG